MRKGTPDITKPIYARTFSATSCHVINPANPVKTLCGGRASLRETFQGDDGTWKRVDGCFVIDLPLCRRCEASANKRGIALP